MSNFVKIFPVEGPICFMRTDGQTDMTKLTVAFRNFTKIALNPGPLPLFTLQILHELPWNRTRASAMTG